MAIALIPQATTGTMSAKVYNNLVSSRSQGIVLYEDPSMTVTGNTNNLWNTPGGNVLGSYDLGAMYAQDPLYVDAAGGDFRLSPASPLANSGQTCIPSLPLPRGDAIGMFRVAEGTVDLGAFERDSMISGRVKGKNLTGNGGPNTIRGTSGRDVICGLNGADTLYGLDGADLVIGGNGSDRAYGGDGNDRLDLLDGVETDRAYGGAGTDICLTDPGDFRSSCTQPTALSPRA
jgi:Ca2+-binding RTX toxin-like protein